MNEKPEVKVRKKWGDVRPITVAFKNKKLYSRKNKFKKPVVAEMFTGTSSMGTVDSGIMPMQGYRRPETQVSKKKPVKKFKKVRRMKLKEAVQFMADCSVPSPF